MAKSKPSRKPASSAKSRKKTTTQTAADLSVPVVGIGASAGGLEAFTELLKHLPLESGMAFVLVQHLHPDYESMLTELLSRTTRLPVEQVTDGMSIQANHIYVIPPDANLTIRQGALKLVPRKTNRHHYMPIDYFLKSLAEDQGGRAIGIILSGTASDGVQGLKAIKAAGGITFAQDEASAKFFGMPGSAIAAGCVDSVLPPARMAKELDRIAGHPYLHDVKPEVEAQVTNADDIGKILLLLRRITGVDFTYYKQTTLRRRIQRRLVLHKIENSAKYLGYLQKNQAEVEALYDDILIHVTSFFRDSGSYQALAETVFPKITAKE
ncbi:ATPase, partial [bacterium]|nr:ATPase [bacterium]